MTGDQERRFALLREDWCGFEFIYELYGVDLSKEPKFCKHFVAWADQRGKVEVIRNSGTIHRFRFETFLQTLKLMPKKWGALRIGMDSGTLDALFAKLSGLGLVYQYYPSDGTNTFVGEKLDQDMLELFDEFRFRTFSDHNNFCHRLHDAIQKKYDVKVTPVHDITCRFLMPDQQEKWDYAHDWDAVTLEPVSLQFQVWLDLGKPINLRPDCVSTLFYVQERDRLKELVAGTSEPDIPTSLVEAVQKKKH